MEKNQEERENKGMEAPEGSLTRVRSVNLEVSLVLGVETCLICKTEITAHPSCRPPFAATLFSGVW